MREREREIKESYICELNNLRENGCERKHWEERKKITKRASECIPESGDTY